MTIAIIAQIRESNHPPPIKNEELHWIGLHFFIINIFNDKL